MHRAVTSGGYASWMARKKKSGDPFRWFDSSPEVIRLVVMMYVRYPLSLRNVEDLLFERGIDICHETVRSWWNRFGPMFAGEIRRKRVGHMRAYTHWRGRLDEVCVRINGEMHYLWRAVDHEGEVLESYGAALRKIGAADRKQTGRWLNNRVENSDLPFRLLERAMLRFRRMKTLQKFASVHNHLQQERHLVSHQISKQRRSAALAEWRNVMG